MYFCFQLFILFFQMFICVFMCFFMFYRCLFVFKVFRGMYFCFQVFILFFRVYFVFLSVFFCFQACICVFMCFFVFFQVFIPDDPIATLTTLGRKEANEKLEASHSLLLWNVLQAGGSADPNAEYIPHVRFKLRDSDPGGVTAPDTCNSLWSFPIQLNFCPTGTRQSVALPCFDGMYPMTKTCALSAVLDLEIVYLVLDDDFYPSIELVNNCNIALFYGQAILNRGPNGEFMCKDGTV